MIVLHPYGNTRVKEQQETWDFLKTIRKFYRVEDRNVTGKWLYVDFVKEFWGKDDIIILEDDKVPTLDDFGEIGSCPRLFCCFPYPINFQLRTTLRQWQRNFPWTTGFVKFSKEIQQKLPIENWGPFFYSKESRPSIDRAIEEPMIEKFGPMHLHSRFIKHNHSPTARILLKQYAAKILR
jgi:hypothetical protein